MNETERKKDMTKAEILSEIKELRDSATDPRDKRYYTMQINRILNNKKVNYEFLEKILERD